MSEETEKYIRPWTDLFGEQMDNRLAKREKLKELGESPYKNNFTPKNTAVELKGLYDKKEKDEIGETPLYTLAGRILLVRDFGKAAFLQIDDGTERFQFYLKKGVSSEDALKRYKLSDYGDIAWAEGRVFKTNKGELSLEVQNFEILTKSIRPLPEKFHGITDPELKYRQRYLQMIMSKDARKTQILRSRIVQYIREYFYQKDFLEVETPMMHTVAGGATAKPFLTHHNALDMDLFLRIAPELHLKRLIIGGHRKVFEMGRLFRNEGLSQKHNPEFTSIEFYQAYATYDDLMELTEDLLSSLVQNVLNQKEITFGEQKISFATPFKKISLRDSLSEIGGLSAEQAQDKEHLYQELKKIVKDESSIPRDSLPLLQVLFFEEKVESKLMNPTFITQYPIEVSPLSRRNENDPQFVDRFELFINGWEIANAFSELNDPTDQLERFAQQALEKDNGNDEACEVDYDFIRALEYGMPPTAGEGIGIDRLVMLLTNSTSIRDVILFPTLKKESFFEDSTDQ